MKNGINTGVHELWERLETLTWTEQMDRELVRSKPRLSMIRDRRGVRIEDSAYVHP